MLVTRKSRKNDPKKNNRQIKNATIAPKTDNNQFWALSDDAEGEERNTRTSTKGKQTGELSGSSNGKSSFAPNPPQNRRPPAPNRPSSSHNARGRGGLLVAFRRRWRLATDRPSPVAGNEMT